MTDQVSEIQARMTAEFPAPYDREPGGFKFRVVEVFGVEESRSGAKLQIVKAPDRDGKQTYIPVFSAADFANPIDDLGVVSPERVEAGELTRDQAKRVKYALEELGWPLALAVHTLNRPDIDLSTYPKPERVVEGDYSWMWNLVGEGGIGKSAVVTMLAMTHDVEVFGWDVFSERTYEEYLKAMEKFKEKQITAADVLGEIKRVRETLKPDHKKDNTVTLRERLDALMDKYKLRNRANVIIGDTPGVNGGDGTARPMDIFDMFAWQGSEYVTSWMERFVDERGFEAFLMSFPGMRVQAMYNFVEVARMDTIDGLTRIAEKPGDVA
jgi:hypothetical protein